MTVSNRIRVVIAAMATIIMWAAAFPFTKYVLSVLSVETITEARMIIGGLTLFLIGMVKGLVIPKGRDWIWFIGGGLSGSLCYQLLFNWGMITLPAATSSIILALTPLVTAMMARAVYQEKLSIVGWLCILTGFIGVGIVILWEGVLAMKIGAIITFAGMLLFAAYNLFSRGLSIKGYTPLMISTWSMVLAAIIGIPFVPHMATELMAQPIHVWGFVIFLGVFSSAIAFITWSYAIERAEKTADVISFMFISPILVTFISWGLLGEFPNMGFFIGGIVILISLFLFNRYR